MALLSISVGVLSSSVSADDTKAENVLQNVAALHEFVGTNQEKLDQIAELLRKYLTRDSLRYAIGKAEADAAAAERAESNNKFED